MPHKLGDVSLDLLAPMVKVRYSNINPNAPNQEVDGGDRRVGADPVPNKLEVRADI